MVLRFALVLLAASFSPACEAARLTSIQGAVSVDYGAGFRAVSGGAFVSAGNRIRTADGAADLTYDNGCTVHIGPREAVIVSTTPPCAPIVFPGGEELGAGLLIAGGTAGLVAVFKPASP